MKVIEIYTNGDTRECVITDASAIPALVNMARWWNTNLPEGESACTEIKIVPEG